MNLLSCDSNDKKFRQKTEEKGRMDKMKRSWLVLLHIVVAKRVKAQAKERGKKH